jgi:hypothetical protein
MDEGSLIGTLDRIEAVLGRIEASARDIRGRAADSDLERRHRELQSAVQTALSRLDSLLSEQPE